MVSDVAQAELRGLLVAARTWSRESSDKDFWAPWPLSATSGMHRKRAERKAQSEPGIVAQMAEAAAACLVGLCWHRRRLKRRPAERLRLAPAVMSDDDASGGRDGGSRGATAPGRRAGHAPVGDAVFAFTG